MKTLVFPDYVQLCEAVARAVKRQLLEKPESVLVFPTGNTPLGLFRILVSEYKAGKVDFSRAHIVVLDEYSGLKVNDARSLVSWLRRELLKPIGLPETQLHDLEHGPAACEAKIKSLGGLDMVILGLGPNGHLGFNEPGSAFDSRTREVELSEASLASNAAYWGLEVPRRGITLGLGTLAEARSILLMVSGHAKHGILNQTLNGMPSPNIPATCLRLLHHATVFADDSAMTSGSQNA